ncbi:MAG: hypothetical protein L0323_11465 [Planctomycetes bacterium]|nr:hypothetical protein [Planctomycetota bacterium]
MTLTVSTKLALARFFLEECEALLGRAWKILRRLEEAEEAVRETARQAIRSLESVHDPGRIQTWAFQALEAECERRLRRRERDEERAAASAPPDRAAGAEALREGGPADGWGESCWVDDVDEFVRQEVEALPPDLRVVVERAEMGRERLSALAREVGLSRGTLADRRNRALEILRPRLTGLMRGTLR